MRRGRAGLARVLMVSAAALVSGFMATPLEARQSAAARDTARAVHLLQRATYGARPVDIAAVLAEGTEAWLERQLHPDAIPDPALERRLAIYPTTMLQPLELFRDFSPLRQPAQRPGMRDSASSSPPMRGPESMTSEERRARAQRTPARLLGELVGARLTRAVHSERQLEEVLTEFWFNHFNVFFQKGLDRYLVADYERTAIRPHVFGRFEDLLLATARHPAMLFYLDNWTSSVPDSMNPQPQRPAAARPQGRARGINENYARELLELHTLGVDGGYTQADVVGVARAFTGWTFTQPRSGEVAFRFRPLMHDRGEKVVLGRTLPAGRGEEDGRDVIRLLASHPSTARFIAGKLVERFVTDEPAPEFVEELARVFLRTGGDLREVTRALFGSERFYDERYIGTKVRSPYELVSAALRMTGAEVTPSRRLAETLRAMGQLPYTEPAPTGFPASSEDWVNSGAMLARMNFGLALASGALDRVRVDAGLLDDDSDAAVGRMLGALLPSGHAAHLERNIRADLARHSDAPSGTRSTRALGLIIGSPDFQRH